MTRNVLRSRFLKMGWQVDAAATVGEALALLDSEPAPCCLILDVELPDGTGDEVLDKIRNLNLKTKVLVSTGTTDLDKLEAMIRLKPDGFLPKPMTPQFALEDVGRDCPYESLGMVHPSAH
ncbi:response regulator [Singulisphaera sp. PoT]|uniref:response regulator n=1 Tax=Singulisphaera sp. PoT TaxID=3411797 RepID=UPI003BF61D97